MASRILTVGMVAMAFRAERLVPFALEVQLLEQEAVVALKVIGKHPAQAAMVVEELAAAATQRATAMAAAAGWRRQETERQAL
jgi:hypothetical protein